MASIRDTLNADIKRLEAAERLSKLEQKLTVVYGETIAFGPAGEEFPVLTDAGISGINRDAKGKMTVVTEPIGGDVKDKKYTLFLSELITGKDTGIVDDMIDGIDAVKTLKRDGIKAPAPTASIEEKVSYIGRIIGANLDKLNDLGVAFDKIDGLGVVAADSSKTLSFTKEKDFGEWLKTASQQQLEGLDRAVAGAAAVGAVKASGAPNKDISDALEAKRKELSKLDISESKTRDTFDARVQQEVVDKLNIPEELEKALRTGSLGVLTKDQSDKLFGEGNKGLFQLGFDAGKGKFVPDFDKGQLMVQKGEPDITIKGEHTLKDHLAGKGKTVEEMYDAVRGILAKKDIDAVQEKLDAIPKADRPVMKNKDDPSVMIEHILESGDAEQKRRLSTAMREFGLKPDLEQIPGTDRQQVVFHERVPMIDVLKTRSVDDLKSVADELQAKKDAAIDAKSAAKVTEKVHESADKIVGTLAKAGLEAKDAPMDGVDAKAAEAYKAGNDAAVAASDKVVDDTAWKSKGFFGKIGYAFGSRSGADFDAAKVAANEARVGAIAEAVKGMSDDAADRGEIIAKMVADKNLDPALAGKVILAASKNERGEVSAREQIDMIQGAMRSNGFDATVSRQVFASVNIANRENVPPVLPVSVDSVKGAYISGNAEVVGEKLNELIESKAITTREAGTALEKMVSSRVIDVPMAATVLEGIKDDTKRAEVDEAAKNAKDERLAAAPAPAKSTGGKKASASPAIDSEGPSVEERATKVTQALIDNPKLLELMERMVAAAETGKSAGMGGRT